MCPEAIFTFGEGKACYFTRIKSLLCSTLASAEIVQRELHYWELDPLTERDRLVPLAIKSSDHDTFLLN